MDLSITAVTANRSLGRALTRVAGPLEALKVLLSGVTVDGWKLRTLQVVLMDRPETHVVVQRTPRGSQLMQVAVGLPSGLTFKVEQDAQFLAAIAEQVEKAIEKAGLPDAARIEAPRKILQWRTMIISLLVPHRRALS